MGIAWGGLAQGAVDGVRLGMQAQDAAARRKREEEAAARQAKIDARADEAYQEQQDLKEGVRNAMQEVKPVSGLEMVSANPAVDPAKYDDPSVYNSDVRELRRGGVAPETRPATWVGNQKVDPGQAAMVAGQQNTQGSQLERVAQVYAERGQIDKAMQYKQAADQARTEGADKFIDSVMGRAPGMDALGKGPVMMPVDMTARETFDATGKLKIPEGAQIKYIRQDMPNGQAYVDAQVVDKDGKPLHGGTLRQYQWMMATNPVQRQQVDRQSMLDRVGIADKAADNTRADRALDIQDRGQRDNIALQRWARQKGFEIDERRLNNDETYRNGLLEVQRAQAAAKAASLEERMTPPHKAMIATMDKQEANLQDQIKSTQDAMIKGIAGGTFQETDENGKPTKEAIAIQRTLKNLESQVGSIAMRRADIMRQYDGDGGGKDPLGIRSPKSPGASSDSGGHERVSRETQAARDSDRIPILQREINDTQAKLDAAKDPAERKRIQGDIEALRREMGTMKKSAPAAQPEKPSQLERLSTKPEPLPGKVDGDPMSKLEAIGPAKAGADPMAGRQNLPAKTADAAELPNPPAWAKAQKAAEQARRDDPELKRLQAAVDSAQGRQIHAAKKALNDYLNRKGA